MVYMNDLYSSKVQASFGSFIIPTRPAVVQALFRAQEAGDLREVIKLIELDMGLSAAVMKTVNSAFLGIREKISTVPRAVNLLGLKNVANLVAGLSLRKIVTTPRMHDFWEDSARTALVSAHLAQSLGGLDKHQAHLYGLFQDVGKVLMMLNFPNYTETLNFFQSGENLFRRELTNHKTTHGQIGFLLAQNWGLPAVLVDAIQVHDRYDLFIQKSSNTESRKLIAVTRLAKIMISDDGQFDFGDSEDDQFNTAVIDHLYLGRDELERLHQEVATLY
jgi:HD-like signal output (HDOD) protein